MKKDKIVKTFLRKNSKGEDEKVTVEFPIRELEKIIYIERNYEE